MSSITVTDLQHYLTPSVWALVEQLRALAVEQNVQLYLAGGLVRDVLLQEPSTDLDFVVEGDAIAFARRVQQTLGGELRTHDSFGTANWRLTSVVWTTIATPPPVEPLELIDFATARTELYAAPAALPTVKPSTIEADLQRRDFAINAMALNLAKGSDATLFDYFAGQEDLTAGIVRILHPESFVDDPTRLFRAVRFAERLKFRFDTLTERRLVADKGGVQLLTGERIQHELVMMLQEREPAASLAACAKHRLLREIDPELAWQPEGVERFARLHQLATTPSWREAFADADSMVSIGFGLWLGALPAAVIERVAQRLLLTRKVREIALGVAALMEGMVGVPAGLPPSQAYQLIAPFAKQATTLIAARAFAKPESPAVSYLEQFWNEWQHVDPILNGDNLRQMGLRPGPIFRDLLTKLRYGRLDGELSTEDEERAFVAAFVSGEASGRNE